MAKSAILSVRVVGNATDARRKLNDTERSLDRLGRKAGESSAKLSRMYQQHDRAATAALKIGALSVALQAATVATARTAAAIAPLAGLLAVVPGAAAAGGAALATFKTATAGFGDAVAAAGEGTEKFTEATKGMHASMVSAVKATADVGKAFAVVRTQVQGSFWSGVDSQVRNLGASSMPILAQSMTSVADAGNKVFTELLKVAGTGPVLDSVKAAFAATERSLKGLAPAVAPFVSGIAALVTGSAGLIKGFTGAEDAAKRFNAWATRITSDGTLARWFDAGKAAASALGSALRSIGSILASVGRAALAAAGDGGGLGGFADAMKRIADIVSGPEMQSKMVASFQRANMVMQAVVAILPTLIRFGPELVLIGAAWRVVSLAAAAYRGVAIVVTAVQTLMGSTAAVSLAKMAAGWARAGAAAMVNGARMAAAWLLALGPIGLLIAAIVLIVGAFAIAYAKCAWFRNAVNAAASKIKDFFVKAWQAISAGASALWSKVKSGVSSLASAVSGAAGRIRNFFTRAWSAVTGAAGSMRARVAGFISAIAGVASSVASRVRGFFSNAARGVSGAFSGILGRIRGIFSSIAGAARNAARRVAGVFSGIMDKARSVSNFVSGIFGSGTMWLKASVASNLPDPGQPFFMEAGGPVLSPTTWGGAGGGSVTTYVTNVTIEGAIDPNETARQIRKVLAADARRDGRLTTGGYGGW